MGHDVRQLPRDREMGQGDDDDRIMSHLGLLLANSVCFDIIIVAIRPRFLLLDVERQPISITTKVFGQSVSRNIG